MKNLPAGRCYRCRYPYYEFNDGGIRHINGNGICVSCELEVKGGGGVVEYKYYCCDVVSETPLSVRLLVERLDRETRIPRHSISL